MARWNDTQKATQQAFAHRLMKIAADSKLTYTEMEGLTGMPVASVHGLINGTLAPRVDHLPGLYKAFGEPVLQLVSYITIGGHT